MRSMIAVLMPHDFLARAEKVIEREMAAVRADSPTLVAACQADAAGLIHELVALNPARNPNLSTEGTAATEGHSLTH